MKVPTIHLNGTARADLVREYTAAYDAVRNAVTLLRGVTVHGRDYYLQDRAAQRAGLAQPFIIAQQEHCDRITALVAVADDLSAILHEIKLEPVPASAYETEKA